MNTSIRNWFFLYNVTVKELGPGAVKSEMAPSSKSMITLRLPLINYVMEFSVPS